MMERYDMPENRAAHVVKSEEKRRTNLYRKIGKQDFDHPELYHLVINMAKVDLDEAVQMIVEMVTH